MFLFGYEVDHYQSYEVLYFIEKMGFLKLFLVLHYKSFAFCHDIARNFLRILQDTFLYSDSKHQYDLLTLILCSSL